MLAVIAIYLLVNIGFLYVLPMSQLVGQDFAAGAVANVIFGRYGDSIFRWLTIVSMLSTINACHLMATRVLFAMSRDGLFLRQASNVIRAALGVGVISVAVHCFCRSVKHLKK